MHLCFIKFACSTPCEVPKTDTACRVTAFFKNLNEENKSMTFSSKLPSNLVSSKCKTSGMMSCGGVMQTVTEVIDVSCLAFNDKPGT